MRFKKWSAVLVALIGVQTAFADTAEAAAPDTSCTNYNYRAGMADGYVTNAFGVRSVIETPGPSQVYGYGSGKVTAADIYLSYGGAFVQVGWYLGEATGLPLTYTPRLFWGENVPGGETLHAGANLSLGTIYAFAILPSATNGFYRVLLQDNIVGTSQYAHDVRSPGFNGEVDYACTRMDAQAAHGSGPERTLQYYSRTSSQFFYFDNSLFTNASNLVSTRLSDIATNYAYGGG